MPLTGPLLIDSALIESVLVDSVPIDSVQFGSCVLAGSNEASGVREDYDEIALRDEIR